MVYFEVRSLLTWSAKSPDFALQVLSLFSSRATGVVFHVHQDQDRLRDRLQTDEIKDTGKRLLQVGREEVDDVQKGHAFFEEHAVVILSKEHQQG